ncbi:MAG: ATP-binding protein [bacterium]|nr:ATP-binding protein [bacterium]
MRFQLSNLKWVFLFVLVAFHVPSWARKPYRPVYPNPVLESWRWQVFPELKGLGLRCLAEAKDGAMWFGTNEGVRRYDGLSWKVYTPEDGLLGAPVNVVSVARDGSVYAGTDWGISRFDGTRWERVFPPEGDLTWPMDQILEAADGTLWAATAWGGLKLEDAGATLYTTQDMATALSGQVPYVRVVLVPDSVMPKRIWGEGTGIKVTKGGYLGISRSEVPMVIWALVPGGPGEAAGLKVGDHVIQVDDVIPDLPHLVLEGSGGPVRLRVKRPGRPDPFEVTVSRSNTTGQYSGFSVSDVFEDRSGRIWFGLSWGGEIARLTPDGDWRIYTAQDGLGLGDRPRITQLQDGTILTVSNHSVAGLNRFDGEKWDHIFIDLQGGTNIHTAILETKEGTLWLGGHNGKLLAHRNQKEDERAKERLGEWSWSIAGPTEMPVSKTRIAAFLEASDGALWIAGLGQEVSRLDYGTSRWTTYQNMQYQCETPDGSLWFLLNKERRVVRSGPDGWFSYGVEDGLMDRPTALLVTSDGTLWAAGGHKGEAATGTFDGTKWMFKRHPKFAAEVDRRGAKAALDGTLWFGASVDRDARQGQIGGVLAFNRSDGTWTHHIPPDAPVYVYGMGQSADGILWFGGTGLHKFDGRDWSRLREPKGLTSWVHGILGSSDGGLWVGTRAYGLYYLNGEDWIRYGVRDGLANNRINAILETADRTIWVTTDKGISRFDGQTWTSHALPQALLRTSMDLRASADGAIWISSPTGVIRYEPEKKPPETQILVSLEEVSQPGNTTLVWKGADPWQSTPDGELAYSWRLDEGPWSSFSSETTKIFSSLSSGNHTFEVKTRDRDFNQDPTPATAHFYVVPPIWQQPWFLGLMGVLVVAIGVQTQRVIRRDRRLQESNRQLQQQTEELAAANRKIQEANRLKSQFLANMSHELRTPLNAILGFSQLMNRDSNLSPEHRENLTVIGRSGEHLLALINDVLDMSKIEAGQTTLNEVDFDLYPLLDGLEEMFLLRAGDKGLELVFNRPEEVPQYVRADAGKLRQVLINLLGNAIKFTETGSVTLGVRGGEGRLYFEIEDTGPGIASEEQAVLFDAFVQTAAGQQVQGGTGLGLPISQEFVRLMGGEIVVVSQVGRGSAFRFDIRVKPSDADAVVDVRPSKRVVGIEPGQSVYRILVVEDRLENRKLLCKMLQPMGFEVREATNGQEALSIWEAWRPHLIWMDMRMPVMDGYEATRRIKATEQGRDTVVVALTASAFEEQRAEVLSAGCDEFVRKPFREEEIFAVMAEHLGVRFVYESDSVSAPPKPSRELTSEDLSVLPSDWMAELNQAAARADADLIALLLEQIEPDHGVLAGALKDLVYDFRFDRLMDLTDASSS